jgi:hypothetical protein
LRQQDQKRSPDTKLVPYNTISGSLVEKSGKRFFPGHSQSSQIHRGEPLFPKIELLSDVVANCIFGDHSMITVEQGSLQRHGTVKEYRIVYSGVMFWILGSN